MKNVEVLMAALLRLKEIAKEVDGIEPHITDNKLYLELSNGMNLQLSDEEVIYQAFEYKQN